MHLSSTTVFAFCINRFSPDMAHLRSAAMAHKIEK